MGSLILHHKTKFPTIMLMNYLSKWQFWEQLSPIFFVFVYFLLHATENLAVWSFYLFIFSTEWSWKHLEVMFFLSWKFPSQLVLCLYIITYLSDLVHLKCPDKVQSQMHIILRVNEKLPLLKFRYFENYKRNLDSYFTFLVSDQLQTCLEQ